MGKSPGKWIKTVLFGKKVSRSNLSKGRDDLKSSNEKEALVSKSPTAGLVATPPLISQTEPIPKHKNGENSELELWGASNVPRDGVVLVPGDEGADKQGTTPSDASNGLDRIRQEQAATKVQAAFRGYLARRAFRALMGIIRLQALVRGHLARRQAVATLRCVRAIVKFQALVRGQRTCAHAEKILTNSFISKLIASSPNTKPLRLQYDLVEPNSAWSWLERWTKFRVWEPLPQPKKVNDSKSHTRPKRSVRKVPSANIDNGAIRSEKPKRNMKKLSGHPVDIVQESSQNELEKVKRSLRKVSNSTNDTADQNGLETEKPKRIPRKTSGSKSESAGQVEVESERMKCIPRRSLGSLAPDVPEQGMVESADKIKKEEPEQSSEHHVEERTPKPSPKNEIVDVLHADSPALDLSHLENRGEDESTPMTNGKLISKEDEASNENQKSRRRVSLPAKQESPETGLQNTPKVPSYMAATESVKAKLRAQGSPRSAPDVTDQNALTRRHSLPSSTNGKVSSLSPRTQRPQANSKGAIKQDRSILSSKDGNEKVSPVEWRR